MTGGATWLVPALEKVVFERPAAEVVAEETAGRDHTRVLVLTSRSVRSTALVTGIVAALGERCAGVYSDVPVQASAAQVLAAAEHARAVRADLIVAVGGGSVIDAAKVVVICLGADLTEPAGLDPYRGLGSVSDASRRPADEASWVRFIAVPTTLSAAEFTWWGGVMDPERGTKGPVAHPLAIPRMIVLDPEATRTAPLHLVTSTGVKAVDHAVERLCAPVLNPLTEAHSVHSLRLLARALPAVASDEDDLAARAECQAGMAIGMIGPAAGSRVGASHAIGHALGAHSGVPHGITSCVMLPAVLRWNRDACPQRQQLVSSAMGRPGVDAAKVVEDLVVSVGLPVRLQDIGIERSELATIARKTMGDMAIGGNPRPVRTVADVLEILESAW
ncbi:iron-containing alcohol dehydrogenase [Pseudonocardia sp. CA-107938]|uniref:iron-containing alcohol dehydrogenase n=1 Tax=Pseudonocardia sp. CA-107938 TaxID=3240021 RepID=UPI003D8E48CA